MQVRHRSQRLSEVIKHRLFVRAFFRLDAQDLLRKATLEPANFKESLAARGRHRAAQHVFRRFRALVFLMIMMIGMRAARARKALRVFLELMMNGFYSQNGRGPNPKCSR
jgi:hypothetical protein